MTQDEALTILKQGHNVLLTGPAGSGKTHLLNRYISYLKENDITVGITASTGIAATHLEGRTIHSFAGIGIKDQLTPKDLHNIQKRGYLRRQFKNTQVLVIDEVSMLNAHTLDMVDKVCRAFKEPFKPFGGMQVVLCGDFFQLPPVSSNGQEACFITSSHVWGEMNTHVCYLSGQYRQTDEELSAILADIRAGEVSTESRELLRSRYQATIEKSLSLTRLYTHNIDVDTINRRELEKLDSKKKTYTMRSGGNKNLTSSLKTTCLAPEKLALKKDAVVMFVKNNFSAGYVNGTLGKVIGFTSGELPVVKIKDGKKIEVSRSTWRIEGAEKEAWIEQLPLRLAWAITVHKSQGMSLDAAEMDLSKTFEFGMGYVALSRVRSLNGLRLMGINEHALKVSDHALMIDNQLKKLSESTTKKVKKLSKKEKKKQEKSFLQTAQGK